MIREDRRGTLPRHPDVGWARARPKPVKFKLGADHSLRIT
jgi:hypothetical protein